MTKFIIRLFIKNDDVSSPDTHTRYGMCSGIVGVIINIILFTLKFIASLLTHSVAIQADAFNNLSDAGTSVVTILGFRLSSKPADKGHPFGHGRFEYVSGLIVSMAIILMGIELIKSSIDSIISSQATVFNTLSLIIMMISVLAKLWLSLFNKTISKKIHSETIAATSLDSLSDVAATSAVIISILINRLAGLNIDGYIGILVALFIIYSGIKACISTLNPLLGQMPDPELVKEIEDKVLSYDGIVGIHDLIVHSYGANRKLISLHAEVPSEISIFKSHDLIDNIEKELNIQFNCEAVIHMDPISVNDELTNELHITVKNLIVKFDPELSIHDFRIVSGPTHTNLIFDIVVPFKYKLSDTELIDYVSEEIKKIDCSYAAVLTVDRSYVNKE